MQEIAWLLLVASISACVQGLTGFGFGIVAISLLPIVFGFKESVSLVTLLIVVVTAYMIFRSRHSFAFSDLRVILIGVLIGVPTGVALVVYLDEYWLLKLFGALNLAIAVHFFAWNQKRGNAFPNAFALPVGLLSGLLAGAFSMGGPPLIAYLYSKPWPLDRIKAILATAFLIISLVRLPFAGFTTERIDTLLLFTLICLIPLWLSIKLGYRFASRIPIHHLKTGVYGYLGMMGLYYLMIH